VSYIYKLNKLKMINIVKSPSFVLLLHIDLTINTKYNVATVATVTRCPYDTITGPVFRPYLTPHTHTKILRRTYFLWTQDGPFIIIIIISSFPLSSTVDRREYEEIHARARVIVIHVCLNIFTNRTCSEKYKITNMDSR